MGEQQLCHVVLSNDRPLDGIEAVLFDFDDTLQLGDKAELYERLYAISQRLGMTYSPGDIIEFSRLSGSTETRQLMIKGHNKNNPDNPIGEELFKEVAKDVSGQFDYLFRLAEGTKELLDYLKNNGYRIGLVTTRGSNSLYRLLERHGIYPYFEVVVNGDDSPEKKPHPRPIVLALEKLNVDPSEAMYVGNTQREDIIAGNSAGVKTVLVSPIGPNKDYIGPNKHYAQPHYNAANLAKLLHLFVENCPRF